MPRVALASPCRPGPWEIFRLHLQIEPTKAETFKERCIPKFASRPTATLALSAPRRARAAQTPAAGSGCSSRLRAALLLAVRPALIANVHMHSSHSSLRLCQRCMRKRATLPLHSPSVTSFHRRISGRRPSSCLPCSLRTLPAGRYQTCQNRTQLSPTGQTRAPTRL